MPSLGPGSPNLSIRLQTAFWLGIGRTNQFDWRGQFSYTLNVILLFEFKRVKRHTKSRLRPRLLENPVREHNRFHLGSA